VLDRQRQSSRPRREPLTARTRLAPFTADLDLQQRLWEAPRACTVTGLLSAADLAPQVTALLFVDHGRPPEPITWSRLRYGAASRAARLVEAGVKRGDRVIVMVPTGPGFFDAFFGTLMVSATPVPVAPPHSIRPDKLAVLFAAVMRIADDCSAAAIVGAGRSLALLADYLREHGRRLPLVSAEETAPSVEPPRGGGDVDPSELALLQYTSGSTSDPKGVALTHAAVIANSDVISGALARPTTTSVSWLPLYHDMGLIGCALTTLYARRPQVLMPPQAFVKDPVRWLQDVSDIGADTLVAPNFAYALCTRSITDEDMAGVDLSSVQVALNGAEPIDPATIDAFEERFAKYGVRPGTIRPVYGLAECALAVTFGDPGPAHIDVVDADRLERDGCAEPSGDSARRRTFVAVGRPLPGTAIRIVGGDDREVPDRVIGEIAVRGPSVMSGYYGRPDESAAALRGGWLHTGDLGYVADGRLFITGRSKDLLIRSGRNYYAQDIERAIMQVPGLINGGVAAFGIGDLADMRIVVVAESRKRDPQSQDEIQRRIREACQLHFDMGPDDIQLVAPGAIPRTTSGKVRRQQTRRAYEAGELAAAGQVSS
jgi:acyl-CoA synthetase (AMP-forming)/AMP-acid ligase II